MLGVDGDGHRAHDKPSANAAQIGAKTMNGYLFSEPCSSHLDDGTRKIAILTFGPAPAKTYFSLIRKALEAAQAFKQSPEGCGSTIRVVEFGKISHAKNCTIANYTEVPHRVLATY